MKEQDFISGLLPDPFDARDILLRNYLLPIKGVPSEFSWDDERIPILNQGTKPYCVAYSSSSMKMFMENREHGRIYPFEADELYFRCKEIDGLKGKDGTTIRAAMKVLLNRGILFIEKKNYLYFPIASYTKITSLEELKVALVASGPFPIGVVVFRNWFNGGKIIDIPEEEEIIGYHAINVIGYSDKDSLISFRNSWGTDWGDKGKAFLTYSYFKRYLVSARSAVDLEDRLTSCFINQMGIKRRIDMLRRENA